MKTQMTIPYFTIDAPYELAYRNNGTSSPARPHTHNALEIYLTMSDLPDVLLDDTVSSVSKGSLIIIPPHHVHQLFNQKLTIYERYVLNINSDWLYTVLGAGSGLMPYADPAFSPAILRLSPTGLTGLCSQLDHYLQLHPQPSLSAYADFFSLPSILDSRIQHGLQASSTGQRSISQSQKNINEVMAFINRHLTEPLTLESIAAEFYLNKDYLGRLFKEHTHATIGHYISVQRANLAQTMLAEGRTVTEVQELLGFSSYAYFFKFFKKMTGISPSQYRKDNTMPLSHSPSPHSKKGTAACV